jgi:hypothetical protein
MKLLTALLLVVGPLRDCGGPLRNDALWKTMDPPLDPPRTPILKCFIYLNDVAYDQGPTAVLRGSHLLPWAPDGLYDLHQVRNATFCAIYL